MAAFYYYAVIRDSVDKENERSNNGDMEETVSRSKMSESLETFDVVEEEKLNKACSEVTEQTNEKTSVNKSYLTNSCDVANSNILKMSDQHVHELSQKLLWHTQVKKLELQETLTHIQKAMKIMINKHNMQHSNQNKENLESDDVNLENDGNVSSCKVLLTPPSICRSVSGEYLHMKPGSACFTSSPFSLPKQSPRRQFTPESNRRKRCDSEGHEEMMPCIDENGSDITDERNSPDKMSYSGIMQTRIYTKAHNIFSAEMSQSTSSNLDMSPIHEPNNANNTVKSSVTFDVSEKEKIGTENSDDKTKSILFRNRLHEQPLDTRYCGEDITVPMLSAEYQRVTAELHDFTCMMKVSFRPH